MSVFSVDFPNSKFNWNIFCTFGDETLRIDAQT